MLLAATVTVALFALYLHWSEGGRWCWLGYAAMAMGLLAKGPVAAAIPILATRYLSLVAGRVARRYWPLPCRRRRRDGPADRRAMVHRDRDPRARLHRLLFRRRASAPFFQSSYSHGEPFYYYVPVLAAGMMPWTLMAPFIAWRSLARGAGWALLYRRRGGRDRDVLGGQRQAHPVHPAREPRRSRCCWPTGFSRVPFPPARPRRPSRAVCGPASRRWV